MESGLENVTVNQFCTLIGINIEQFRSCCLRTGVMHNWSGHDLVTDRQMGAVWEFQMTGRLKINVAAFQKNGFLLKAVRGGHGKIMNTMKEKETLKEDEPQPLGDTLNMSDTSIQSSGKSGPEISVPMGGQPGFKKKRRK